MWTTTSGTRSLVRMLGLPCRPWSGVALHLLLATGTVGHMLLHGALQKWTASTLGTHVVLWTLWFLWQGYLFGAHRERHLRFGGRRYARAFVCDILPGATGVFALMIYPATQICQGRARWSGLTLFGGIVLAAGLVILYCAVRTIGVDRALFADEYRRCPKPLVKRGIYGLIRHPLFLGAVAASLGSTLLIGGDLRLAAINALSTTVYRVLEDRRLCFVFGGRYSGYRRALPGFLPRRRSRTSKYRRTGRSRPEGGTPKPDGPR